MKGNSIEKVYVNHLKTVKQITEESQRLMATPLRWNDDACAVYEGRRRGYILGVILEKSASGCRLSENYVRARGQQHRFRKQLKEKINDPETTPEERKRLTEYNIALATHVINCWERVIKQYWEEEFQEQL